MTYTPYLVANFSTGLDKKLQPWLSPDDAQEQLFDGDVYRGVMSKREGYNYFATGQVGGVPYRESRIVNAMSAVPPTTGVIDGVNTVFTFAIGAQIARGSIIINGSNPVQQVFDDGIGGLTGDGIGIVDYLTGAVTVTFTLAPAIASTVLISYNAMPGNPVMMIANFITETNVKELIVADTQYVNKYYPITNTLEQLAAPLYTGTKFDFFTWVNYPDANQNPRLLFCNNADVIQVYNGAAIANYVPMLTGVTNLWCSWMVQMKDRLILLRTTEDNNIYPKRIRISGTGANSDVFDSTATGAGFIDIPDGTWIQGATFNRDDLIIYTEQATWVLKYTGNDTTPFVLNKIDESRGSDAAFSAFTYLNRSSAASKRGLIISDGYKVERQDAKIPDFTFDEVDNDNFKLCFAGVVDADRDHYLIYPPQGQPVDEEVSKRILVTNYDEDNYSIFRLPLSCMGTYITSFNITWNDLGPDNFPNWDSLAIAYANWNSFAYTKGVPFSIGGGHKGEIWRLAVTEQEDNPVKIWDITVINDSTIEITTDWNNFSQNLDDQELGADYIYLTGIGGTQELNDKQFPIIAVTDNNTFQVDISTLGVLGSNLTAYTSGGSASRVIPFDALFKQFNPFVEQDRKVRCGWLYMYVNTTGTNLTRNIEIDNITQTNPCLVTTEVDHGLKTGDQVSFFGITGMTELNSQQAFVTVFSQTAFELDGVDSSGYSAYIGGGYVTSSEKAKLVIEVLTNDRKIPNNTQLNNLSQQPYQGNCTNMTFEAGQKKWYKIFINQVGKFIQFRFKSQQAGAVIKIQATMPGFAPTGRLI